MLSSQYFPRRSISRKTQVIQEVKWTSYAATFSDLQKDPNIFLLANHLHFAFSGI